MAGESAGEQFVVYVDDDLASDVSIAANRNTIEVDPDDPGLVLVSKGGSATSQATLLEVWGYPEEIRVKVGQGRFHIPLDAILLGVSATIDTPSQGADIILDLNKDGVSVFPSPAEQLTIAAGSNLAPEVTVFSTPEVEAGSVLTVDVDQVGTTQPGRDLTVTVRYALQ